MAIKVHDVDPEELRKHLIEKYSIVLLHESNIRIAFSCVEKEIFDMYLIQLLKRFDDLRY